MKFVKTKNISQLLNPESSANSIAYFFVDLPSYCLYLTDEEFKSTIDSLNIFIYADGYYAFKFLQKYGANYYTGPQFFKDSMSLHYKGIILGPSVIDFDVFNEKLELLNANATFDNISLPFVRTVNEIDINNLIEKLILLDAKNIFVVLGGGKQEKLIIKLLNDQRLIGYNFFGIGAAFNFLIGKELKAPNYIIRLRAEWLFRLLLSPKKQYIKYLWILKAIPKLMRK